MPAPPRPRRRAFVAALAVAGAVAVLAYSSRPLAIAAASLLTVDDAVPGADAIYLLSGDLHSRPFLAAQLYHDAWAPIIVVPEVERPPAVELGIVPETTDLVVGLLEELEVPAEAIEVLPFPPAGVTSTHDEAVALRGWVEEHRPERLIVVTSAFHTRRSRWVVGRALDGLEIDIRMAAAADRRFGATDWWRSEAGTLSLVTEYLKLVYYAVHLERSRA